MGAGILAVHPRDPDLRYFEKMPPLGMLWLGGELLRAGHGVEFVDQQVDAREPAQVAEELRPPLALVGGTSHSRFASFETASRIKEVSPHTAVVYGGPHATFTAADTLQNIPAIDIIVRGEGEETCRELASWMDAGGRAE
ncbi:MAG TPA: cobalamin-dependent protein, partial [bacterium]|nr:cobalamin-dependent protein [bacterium]